MADHYELADQAAEALLKAMKPHRKASQRPGCFTLRRPMR